jgi:hypothetical protein
MKRAKKGKLTKSVGKMIIMVIQPSGKTMPGMSRNSHVLNDKLKFTDIVDEYFYNNDVPLR